MKELVVISGKGGTGKTSLMAAFSSLAGNKVLCDADVDAADLHLIMDPTVVRRTEFQSGNTAAINKDLCTECGLCREMCRWDAISAAFDLNLELTRDIENYAEKKGIICLGRIPFDPIFTQAMIQVQTVFEYNGQSTAGQKIKKIWQRLSENLEL
jgi:MinD superfamily P-loop ATPase